MVHTYLLLEYNVWYKLMFCHFRNLEQLSFMVLLCVIFYIFIISTERRKCYVHVICLKMNSRPVLAQYNPQLDNISLV